MVSTRRGRKTSQEVFPTPHLTHLGSLLSPAVRGGERLGALAVSDHQASHTAELDRPSRPDPKRHRGEPIQQHTAPAASASPERALPRNPLRSGHPWEKGAAVNL